MTDSDSGVDTNKPEDAEQKVAWLEDDWMNGVPRDFDLYAPVRAAQAHLKEIGWSEENVRWMWKNIHLIFDIWKSEHGKMPDRLGVGLLGLESVRPLTERQPWECAGILVHDAVDLVRQLENSAYPRFVDLKKDMPRPMETVFAVMCLGHAASAMVLGLQPTYQDHGRAALKAGFWQAKFGLLGSMMRAAKEIMAALSNEKSPIHKKYRSQQHAKLQAARHEGTRKAKDFVLERWAENRTSAAEAGRTLSVLLEKEGLGTFVPDTVAGWIRSHAKKNHIKLR